jgi:hypothetical protein
LDSGCDLKVFIDKGADEWVRCRIHLMTDT